MNSLEKVMVALDNMTDQACFAFLSQVPQELTTVKIGLELFYAYGPDFVKEVHKRFDKKIFLDLKLHDIPNTVEKSMTSLKNLPINFLTVHLSGGQAMLEACQKVRADYMPHVNVLGVSYLTSLSKNDFNDLYGVTSNNIDQQFQRLFNLAQDSGTQGIVCSAQELKLFTSDSKLIKVCPGIRFTDEIAQGNTGDQKRIMSPQDAFKAGANYVVMGRSLTQAKDLQARVNELTGH